VDILDALIDVLAIYELLICIEESYAQHLEDVYINLLQLAPEISSSNMCQPSMLGA
jgi:hypothetical protein